MGERRKSDSELGVLLRRARVQAGLTQESLADRTGLHRTYISLLERGLRSPTVSVLSGLSEALGIRASEILAQFEDGEGAAGGTADPPRDANAQA